MTRFDKLSTLAMTAMAALSTAALSTAALAQDHGDHGGARPGGSPPAAPPPARAAAPQPSRAQGGGARFDGRSGRQEFLPGGTLRSLPAGRTNYAGRGDQPGQPSPAVRTYQAAPSGGPVVRSYLGGRGSDRRDYGRQGESRQAYDGAGQPGRGFDGRGLDARGYEGRENRGYDGRGEEGRGREGRYERGYGERGGYDRGDRYDRGERRAFAYGGRTYYRFHADAYRWPDQRWAGHRWYAGAFLPPFFLVDEYYLNDFDAFGLGPPPYDCRWVRVGYDALLVNIYDGEVLEVVPGVFY